MEKLPFLSVTNRAKLNVTNWAKLVSKKTNLAQQVTFKYRAHFFFLKTKLLKPHIVIVLSDKQC